LSEILFETERLIIRTWRETDLGPFAALNADPEVMRHFPAVMTREASDIFARRLADTYRTEGFSCLPVEVKQGPDFIGYVGLARVRAPNPLAGEVEIGWRLARSAWGEGYASEAAAAWLDFAFSTLDLARVVSFTATTNLPSERVMQRIGMTRRPDLDFDHPALPPGHVLERHIVYSRSR
jgi:ribosomal-protein-alanine N-acetyltransferase